MLFKKELAHKETYYKDVNGQYQIETSYTAYEVNIEEMRDKEGKVLTYPDNTPRYRAVDDTKFYKLESDLLVKEIRDDLFKVIYFVNNDYVEKVEKDGKRIYFVVPNEKVTTLKAGTNVIRGNNDMYRLPKLVGMVVVDDKIIENPRIIAVRPFKSEDHKLEAEKAVNKNYKSKTEENK